MLTLIATCTVGAKKVKHGLDKIFVDEQMKSTKISLYGTMSVEFMKDWLTNLLKKPVKFNIIQRLLTQKKVTCIIAISKGKLGDMTKDAIQITELQIINFILQTATSAS